VGQCFLEFQLKCQGWFLFWNGVIDKYVSAVICSAFHFRYVTHTAKEIPVVLDILCPEQEDTELIMVGDSANS